MFGQQVRRSSSSRFREIMPDRLADGPRQSTSASSRGVAIRMRGSAFLRGQEMPCEGLNPHDREAEPASGYFAPLALKGCASCAIALRASRRAAHATSESNAFPRQRPPIASASEWHKNLSSNQKARMPSPRRQAPSRFVLAVNNDPSPSRCLQLSGALHLPLCAWNLDFFLFGEMRLLN